MPDYEIAEITCPTKYFDDASSINLKNSTIYGIGVLKTSMQFRLQKWGLINNKIFKGQRKPLSKEKLLYILIPIVLFLTAFIWKYVKIKYRDISLDEPFTIFHAQESIKDILLLPTKKEPNPPLFMAILHFWIKFFGIGPYSVRIVPIFFNALTTVFLFFTGKKFFGFWSGIIASGLFLFSTYHFFYGSDTRTYSMISCATAASLYYFLSTLKNPEKISNPAALLIANFFLVYGHYFGWFVIFMQFVLSFLYFKEKKAFKKVLAVIAGTVIIYIPMFKFLIKQFLRSSKGTWVTPPPSSGFINQLKSFMNSRLGLNVVLIILGVGIIIGLITKIRNDKWKELLLVLLWWIVPYSTMFFISSKIPMFIDRYILFNTIGFYLFIGAAIYFLYNKTKLLLPLVVILVLWLSFSKMKTEKFCSKGSKECSKLCPGKHNRQKHCYCLSAMGHSGIYLSFCTESV